MNFSLDFDQAKTWLFCELPERCFLQRVRGTLIKEHKLDDISHHEHWWALKWSWHSHGWELVSLSVALARSKISFPILPLLCPCFLQFLSNSFLLPYLLIRGTPQRMCIIPVRSCKPFMSWEDMLARVLPVPFSLDDTCINFSFPDKSSISFYFNPPPLCFYLP